ncbi:carbon-nitrogen hydrolase family protein [Luteibaculum oceani]|uniref:GNAT family N-acetyltransferase n=1 Tax=Luteibaculum oceani TaxID=1294296 RepID=A0A5C6VIU9_9FLAO|nr:bifunctional GNAT family N-acetyltransferase/carbon-nitrogen hydrolase family protein [Luteibaculum oceani]TXC85373.1 GNAT family N-acetyltransferase [Luteibaculum oceani]
MQVELRKLNSEDYLGLKESMISSYPNWEDSHWKEHHINALLEQFPAGQFCVTVDGKFAACALSIIINLDNFGESHTYKEITGDFKFTTHDPFGNVLYGIDIFVHPDFRGLRLGRRLYDARKELCEELNLKAIVFGGRIPNYHKYQKDLTPREYIEKVRHKEIHDPVLNFQLSNDFHAKKILKHYLPGDKESKEYAVLLQWDNIYYEEPSPEPIKKAKPIVRLGLVQWQMRPYASVDELLDQVEYFVDAVSGYRCDFVLFPEFFNAPLMAQFNHLSESDAIRKLAEFTDSISKKFAELAIGYNINIVGGSMPVVKEDQRLYNVGYLYHRSGKIDEYIKIHPTPDEVKVWGMAGGDMLRTFDTDCGKIGVLICYDVEFPELSRILADDEMHILFVPFLTDTQNGYGRVRYCAQARAIENEVYVALAGSVGNLPKVHNMDIQYAQSVVFTPCDFSFPTNGIKTEATPNTEMILIADCDTSLLKELHENGAVTNLKDRRKDLYNLERVNLKK